MRIKVKLKISEHIKAITPYPPGKPLEELEREYGISGSIKLASNESPFGPSPLAVEAMQAVLTGLHRYPDGSGYYVTKAISSMTGFDPGEIVLGNGSNEIIDFLVKAFVQSGDEVISSFPSFLMYQKFVATRGGKNIVKPLKQMTHDLNSIMHAVTDKTRLLFLDNPNNPCGTVIPPPDFYCFISDLPEQVIVVLDEAYIDFMDLDKQIDIYSLIKNNENRCGVVSMRTLSKAYGLAGIRLGFGLMNSAIAACLHKVRQPFNVNRMALVGGEAALKDQDFYRKTIELTARGKEFLIKEVTRLGCTVYPSQTNFFMIDVNGDATRFYERMLRKGVIVRSMKAYGFPTCIRITVGTAEENKRFLKSFEACLGECGYG